jgi:hypothetical protein
LDNPARRASSELTFVLANRWQELGLTIDPHDFTDAEAIAAVATLPRRLTTKRNGTRERSTTPPSSFSPGAVATSFT